MSELTGADRQAFEEVQELIRGLPLRRALLMLVNIIAEMELPASFTANDIFQPRLITWLEDNSAWTQ